MRIRNTAVLTKPNLPLAMFPIKVIRLVGEHMSGKVTLSPLLLTKPNLPLAEIAAILKQVSRLPLKLSPL